MKNYASSSFAGGLITDLNEAATPSQVLTDALNATLLTNNGNEITLQNDMGNASIGTSYLPEGYVPVGMKEFGGIIYVASYNPETKKGQIGSFPSPQQLFLDSKESDSVFTIKLEDFLKLENGVLYIKSEFKNIPIFKDVTFHNGDKFVITLGNNEFSSEIIKAIHDGVLNIKLGIMSSAGGIFDIEPNNIKTFTHSAKYGDETISIESFISNTTDVEDALKESTDVQVLKSNHNGSLIITVEYNTIKSFNLTRKYFKQGDNLSVEFIGDIKLHDSVKSLETAILDENSKEPYKVNKASNTIQVELTDEIHEYSISPMTPYGVLSRLNKSGTIDPTKLSNNSQAISNWSQFVGNDSLVINWSYDYYDVNNREISKIVFKFIPIDKAKNAKTREDLVSIRDCYKYEKESEAFSGDFEEYIELKYLQEKSIYICRIYKVFKDNGEEDIDYKLVYVSTLYNKCSAKDLEGFIGNRPKITYYLDVEQIDNKFSEKITDQKLAVYEDGEKENEGFTPNFVKYNKNNLSVLNYENSFLSYNYKYEQSTSGVNEITYRTKIKSIESDKLPVNTNSIIGEFPLKNYYNLIQKDLNPTVEITKEDSQLLGNTIYENEVEEPSCNYVTYSTSQKEDTCTLKITTNSVSKLYSRSGAASSVSITGEALLPAYEPHAVGRQVDVLNKDVSMVGGFGGLTSGEQFYSSMKIPKGKPYESDNVTLVNSEKKDLDTKLTFLNTSRDKVITFFVPKGNTKNSIESTARWGVRPEDQVFMSDPENIWNFNANYYEFRMGPYLDINSIFPKRKFEDDSACLLPDDSDEVRNMIMPVMRDIKDDYVGLNIITKRDTKIWAPREITLLLSQLLIAKPIQRTAYSYTPKSENLVKYENLKAKVHVNFNSSLSESVNLKINDLSSDDINELLNTLNISNFLPEYYVISAKPEFDCEVTSNLDLDLDIINSNQRSMTWSLTEEEKTKIYLGKVIGRDENTWTYKLEVDSECKYKVFDSSTLVKCKGYDEQLHISPPGLSPENIVLADGTVGQYIFNPYIDEKTTEYYYTDTDGTECVNSEALSFLPFPLTNFFTTAIASGKSAKEIIASTENYLLLKDGIQKELIVENLYNKNDDMFKIADEFRLGHISFIKIVKS